MTRFERYKKLLARPFGRLFGRYKSQPAKPEGNQTPMCRLVIPIDICECVHCPLGRHTTLGHAMMRVAVCELIVIDCHNDLEAHVRQNWRPSDEAR